MSVKSGAAEGGRAATSGRLRQPYLHDVVTAVRAPALAISGADGQIRAGVDGIYQADRRLLNTMIVRADGHEPEPVRAANVAADQVQFIGVLRELGDDGADPTVTLERARRLSTTGAVETIAIITHARNPITTTLDVELACDLAGLAQVKSGRSAAPLPATADQDGLTWSGSHGERVTVVVAPSPSTMDVASGRMSWDVALDPGERVEITLTTMLAGGAEAVVRPADGRLSGAVRVSSGDHRLSALVECSLVDLDALTAADPLAPGDRFLTAGAPWFLTLFGRDAIWAARLLLPLGTELAGGTLHALARRQGSAVDLASAQEPGKIMHEIRPDRAPADTVGQRLPALYYGSVDATPLWVSLLHDAWRWGLADAEVTALLPAAERAMDWLARYGTAAGGFVSYRDESGRGLANQGWKDSGDAVQFADGRLAQPPIALCEVQGYAHAAALHAAALFDAFGIAGGDHWRSWAAELAERFRAAFWLSDAGGDYPAIALDADGKRVDTVTSNIAHLLGTGLLNRDEERQVIARLRTPDMDSGYGLRTLSSTATGFNPLAYHGGSVWTHDTAIAIAGLASVDDPSAADAAASLIDGLLAAAAAFDFRLPELFGGYPRAQYPAPVPYPAACRPQAWAAAAGIAIVSALLGLRADAPAGTLTIAPMHALRAGPLDVRGLRIGGRTFDVVVRADGTASVSPDLDGLHVAIG
jgi:glycogen debranching enzyme